MLGVLIAFAIDGMWEKHLEKEKIFAKLCLVFMESTKNATVCINAQDLYLNPGRKIILTFPSIEAASVALLDPDLLDVVPYEEADLLNSYVNRLKIFSKAIDIVNGMYFSAESPDFVLPAPYMNTFRDNVASSVAYTKVVQERFRKYQQEYGMYLSEKSDQINDDVNSYVEAALKGRIEGTKD